MERFLTEAGKFFDCFILDSPSAMAAAATMAPRVDGVFFVICSKQASDRVARASLDIRHQHNARVLGIVLNSDRPAAGDDRYKDYHMA